MQEDHCRLRINAVLSALYRTSPTSFFLQGSKMIMRRDCLFLLFVMMNSLLIPPAHGDNGEKKRQQPWFLTKSITEWKTQVETGKTMEERETATRALGFLGRRSKLMPPHFSDEPIDWLDPLKISEEEMKEILGGLEKALVDQDSKVRFAAVKSVAAIGPRANQTAPLLLPLLKKRETELETLEALEQIGPLEPSAISAVSELLNSTIEDVRLQAAETLVAAGADPKIYLPTMLAYIEAPSDNIFGESQRRKRIPREVTGTLRQAGDAAVPALLKALRNESEHVREFACDVIMSENSHMGLFISLQEKKESQYSNDNQELLGRVLLDISKSYSGSIPDYVLAAMGDNGALPEETLAFLVSKLQNSSKGAQGNIAAAIGRYRQKARHVQPELFKLLEEDDYQYDSDHTQTYIQEAIQAIGFDRKLAQEFSELKTSFPSQNFLYLFSEFPDEAITFLKNHPKAAEGLTDFRSKLFLDVLKGDDPKYQELKSVLYDNNHLPLRTMALLSDPAFLPRLEERIEKAKSPDAMLLACARACGRTPERIVKISATEEGDYLPQSAKPEGEFVPRKRNQKEEPSSEIYVATGCGFCEVLVTGVIQNEKGSPISNTNFFRVNDALRMGKRQRIPLNITLNEQTGQFVFHTTVGSCTNYSSEGTRTSTGSTMVRVEAEGYEPLVVKFYEAMPHVEITLSAMSNQKADQKN